MSHGQINHDQSEPKIFAILVFILLVILFLVGIFLFSYFYFQSTITDEFNSKENYQPTAASELLKLRDYEQEKLTQLRWIDKKKGLVQLPIDIAMSRIVDDYKK